MLVTYNMRFPGQCYQAETGLNYNYFRDFDPAVGRYVESDPLGLPGGLNTYTYVGGNPIQYMDPYGLTCASNYQFFMDWWYYEARRTGVTAPRLLLSQWIDATKALPFHMAGERECGRVLLHQEQHELSSCRRG